MERIPIAGPWITDREVRYVSDAATHGWYAHANDYVERFERSFAEYIGVPYAIALPSCTSAIHLALAAAGVGLGDEVLVPDVTWIATAAPVSYVRATPRFVDIDRASWCLSAAAVEDAITSNTKAVIAVDLYGNMPDWYALQNLCSRRGLLLIEDAAEAIGTRLHGSPAGSFGDIGVFSFHGSKTITTGEGGMLVTRRRDLWERALVLRDHGRAPNDRAFFNGEVAYKYKMSSLEAALGLAQIERIDEIIERKQAIMSWYREEFANETRLELNPDLDGVDNSYWMVTAVFDASLHMTKESAARLLAVRGVDTRPFFYPLSSLPAYQGSDSSRIARERNRIAYNVSWRGVNLPSALCLTRRDVARVSAAVKEMLDEAESLTNQEAA